MEPHGEYQYEQRLEELRRAYPDKLGIYIGYNDALAHRIYAASDFFLMPSLFEPCGLGQMIAQRYGTLPIVRRTGGLKDSVINFDSGNEEISKQIAGYLMKTYDFESLGAGIMLGAKKYVLKCRGSSGQADIRSAVKILVNIMSDKTFYE